MNKRRSLQVLTGIFLTGSLISVLMSSAQETKEPVKDFPEMRADVITIDALNSFGDLEQPAVVFLHDLHTDALKNLPTDALKERKRDCAACHLSDDKDRQSPKFKRLQDTTRQEVMEIYHLNCHECHREVAKAGVKSGPVEVCGQCHRGTPKAVSDKQLLVFNRSLHYRHSEAAKDKCERCHHEYNEATKELFYAKGKEGSCRYCHQQRTEENRISIKLASHLACISCHQKTLAEKKETAQSQDKDAGPINCSGCHAEKSLQLIKKIKDVPRMKRDQPDVVLIQAAKTDTGKQDLKPVIAMNPVPFDHKAHEGYSDTCRVCHHADLQSCSKKCHTLKGAKEGNFVQLERAFHQTNSDRSCQGCHATSQGKQTCAGCHALIGQAGNQETSSCMQCHAEPPSTDVKLEPEAMARMMLSSRTAMTDTYGDEDIPEAVTIDDLADKYEPVYFPHRKIVRTLMAGIKEDKLAQHFHNQKGTVCQACHHQSPPAKKPPRCHSCHGKPFDETEPLRPGMKGAYHQQCFGCHQEMGIKKPDSLNCVECHKERK